MKCILVSIDAPRKQVSAALERGILLAKIFDSKLLLFHSLGSPPADERWDLRGTGGVSYRDALQAAAVRALESLAVHARRAGVMKVDTVTAWDYPIHDAIVRAARASHSQLIVAQPSSRGRSILNRFANTDWELIRSSPLPVLFARGSVTYAHRHIIGAVDPLHEREPQAGVVAEVARVAGMIAAQCDGKLTLAYGFSPAPSLGGTLLRSGSPQQRVDRMGARMRAEAERRLTKARRVLKLPAERAKIHVEEGHPVEVITALAGRLRAPLVVMGAVSRSALQRIFIGNLAEQMLDVLKTDVLVVKPKKSRRPLHQG